MGHLLGELTNELVCKDVGCKKEKCTTEHYITLTSGPKSYAYQTESGFIQMKIRGFSLNHSASQTINFDSFKNLILNDKQGSLVTTNPKKIIRIEHKQKIVNREESKNFSMVFDKRILLADYRTLPYGYRA